MRAASGVRLQSSSFERCYAMGGHDTSTNATLTSTELLDADNVPAGWTAAPPLLSPRAYFAAVSLNGTKRCRAAARPAMVSSAAPETGQLQSAQRSRAIDRDRDVVGARRAIMPVATAAACATRARA